MFEETSESDGDASAGNLLPLVTSWEADPSTGRFTWLEHDPASFLHELGATMGEPELWRASIHPLDAETAATSMRAQLKDRRPRAFSYRFRGRDGKYRALHQVLTSRPEDTSVHGVLLDDGRFEELIEDAGATPRVVALGRLAPRIAHEMNNLFTVVLGCLDAPRRTDELLEGAALVIEHGSSQLKALIDVSKSPKTGWRVDVGAMLESLRPVLEHGPKRRRVVLDLPEERVVALATPGELQGSIINLHLNAVAVSPADATITIGARPVAVDLARAGRLGIATGAHVELFVRDEGKGFDDVQRRRMTLGKGAGPSDDSEGIGLATVAEFVRRIGGALEIRPAEPSGTEIRLILRAATPDASDQRDRG